MEKIVSLGQLKNSLKKKDNYLFVFNDYDSVIGFSDLLINSKVFDPWELLPFEPYYKDKEKASNRFELIYNLKQNNVDIVITTLLGLYQKIANFDIIKKYFLNIKIEKEYEFKDLTKKLSRMGYERKYEVRYPAQFAVRGEILDIYVPNHKLPVRIVFWDRQIDEIKTFNPETQLTIENINSVLVSPLKEIIFDKKIDFDRLMDYDIPVLDFMENEDYPKMEKDFPKIYKKYHSLLDFIDEEFDIYFEKYNDIDKNFKEQLSVIEKVEDSKSIKNVKSFFGSTEDIKNKLNNNIYSFNFVEESKRYKKVKKNLKDKELIQKIDLWKNKDYQITIFFDNFAQKENFVDTILEDTEKIKLIIDDFEGSYVDKKLKKVYLYEREILGKSIEEKNIEYAKGYKHEEHFIHDLSKGDLIVHIDYGIGIYRGVINDEIANKKGDFVVIEYKNNSKIYIPVNHLDKIEKYIGDKQNVKIHSLNNNIWKKTKSMVKNKVRDFAVDLLKLQAERNMKEGYQFSEDTKWQKRFEKSFVHEPTKDQLLATKEIKDDMQSNKLMERLLCGDVGFGKTEVAMRAVFKSIQDGKQVAVLAPTTVLAIQHYETFKSRMREFPVDIKMLSRLVKRSEERETKKKLKKGMVDILIGTHKILSKDIKFNDLGLLIIDEEQRFGVMHKEKLKIRNKNIDTLTLTATPIPRTLYMSLVGIMDLSRLESPPKNRHPIKTKSISFNDELLREIIFREVKRGGQIYFIHNRVKDIKSIKNHLDKVVNDKIEISYIHGQMSPKKIEKRILKFMNGKIDLLIATTIIENGIDISNVNTIIINDAHRFGLSQLYQLRGRVGRREMQAYAYLITPPVTSKIAKQRINALLHFEHLGAGYEIAMRDLELRGAGNLIGKEQSGYMNMIGYELYMKLLKETVAELKGEEIEEKISVNLDLGLNTLIPDSYIKKGSLKIKFYKKIYKCSCDDELDQIKKELKDRYGSLPKEVELLFETSKIRLNMKKYKIKSIELKNKLIEVKFYEEIDFDSLFPLIEKYKNRIEFKTAEELIIELKINMKKILKEVKEFIQIFINNYKNS